jgi:hypothetical protein
VDDVKAITQIAFGMLVYVVLLWIARRVPSAASLMLLFPALNGLGLFFEGDKAPEIARTMILLPLINGLLCAVYIWIFILAPPAVSTLKLTGICTTMVVLLWSGSVLWVWLRRRNNKPTGIGDPHQLRFGLIWTVVLIAATVTVSLYFGLYPPGAGQSQSTTSSWANPADIAGELVEVAMSNLLKVTLFFFGLLFFIVVSSHPRAPAWLKGFMGGFPIVPFGGLISLSSGQETAAVMGTLHQMAGSVWASPIVPLWFILLFTRYLALTRSVALHVLGLFAGWAGCLIAIAGISWLLLSLQ